MGARLGITTRQLLAAVFGGSDGTVLTGRTSEDDWWQQVRCRPGISQAALSGCGPTSQHAGADAQLLACLRRVRDRARTAIVSNAWPHARTRLTAGSVAGLVDTVVLSCEAGVAKPDRRIFELALARLDAEPANALFIDDTPGHVAAAEALGIAGHVHTGTETTTAAIEAFAGTA